MNADAVEAARTILAEKHNVAQKYLDYIGCQDEREEMCLVVFMFNIMDKTHIKFKSTVGHIERY